MEWSNQWKLLFNVDKCKSLHLGCSNKKKVYNMEGYSLQQVCEEKDLGVIIDENFKFHKQTAAAVKKANMVLGMLKKSFILRDRKTLPLL